MVDPGTLVVGASQAGLQVAASLRERGDTSPVTVVGAEPHPPYQRPPLSKELLHGGDPAMTTLRTPAWYADADVQLRLGERVVDLVMSRDDGGGTATTDTGRELEFARLALAVGARHRRLDVPGADLAGICYLRELSEAQRLRHELAAARHVVVVGGGFIGLEVAAAARAGGADVTVVEATDRLLSRAVAPVVSEFYRAAHERRGTTVLLSSVVTGFLPVGPTGARGRVTGDTVRVGAVALGDGRELPADLVVVGIGVIPRTELAERIGLACDGGIVVDACARTSRVGVVAAGDCTVQPHPMGGLGRVRLESVPNAVAQGSAAAATLLGRPEPITTVPWFWSYQGDLRLQIAGLSAGWDRLVVRGDPVTEKFSVLYYSEGTLLAVDAVNTPLDYMLVRRTLEQGGSIPADAAADSTVPLRSLVVAVARGLS